MRAGTTVAQPRGREERTTCGAAFYRRRDILPRGELRGSAAPPRRPVAGSTYPESQGDAPIARTMCRSAPFAQCPNWRRRVSLSIRNGGPAIHNGEANPI